MVNDPTSHELLIINKTHCKRLLALLLSAAELFDGGQYGVGVERPQDITEVEGIDLAAAIEVVNGEGEGCPCTYSLLIK